MADPLASSPMFRHIAMFRWTPEITPAQIDAISGQLRRLADSLDVVVEFACGPDVESAGGPSGQTDRYDYAVVATFEDRAAWASYDADEEHTRIRVEMIRPFLASRVVAQFEAPA